VTLRGNVASSSMGRMSKNMAVLEDEDTMLPQNVRISLISDGHTQEEWNPNILLLSQVI
jgi:hypothetical protein